MGRIVRLCIGLWLVLLGAEAYRVVLGSNFHTVVPRHCYRSAQPSAEFLERVIRARGIRTVVNLRGCNAPDHWYQAELDTATQGGAQLVDIAMSAHFKPSEKDLIKLVDVLDHAPEPILLHCGQGSDRTGLASVCYLLLRTDATLEEASRQLSLRYGHFPFGRPICQDALVRMYATWLQSAGLTHEPANFRIWAQSVYVKDDWDAWSRNSR